MASFTPVRYSRTAPPPGATASGFVSHPAHPLGDALRAVKIYVSAGFRVAVLGEYFEEAGVRRR
jgi:hypothetical protein